ncbi:hypothetical protein VMCG_03922 [Cytospora schulzeri]|uniref:WSC domain-containing protein n=1 Tax=Cytospora schulzeri TaxID=448051 RepID=A0A423WV94_9PEZI|nr:hypothetical protein VMCG_03922 [Valsa malicola]
MGRLQRLVASTALLSLGARAEFAYQGCVALDTSTISSTTEIYPQGPTPCADYCGGLGYTHLGITAQFCSCWDTAPTINKTYTNSNNHDCAFNCDAPYDSLYCGGIEVVSLNFLYSYYAVPGVDAASVGGSAGIPASTRPGQGTASGALPTASGSGPGASGFPGAGIPGGATPPGASGTAGYGPSGLASASLTLVPVPGSPGAVTLVPIASVTGAPGGNSPTTTEPPHELETTVPLYDGQAYRIPVARFFRNPGDQVLSYTPHFDWITYNPATSMFWGTVPVDQTAGVVRVHVTAGQRTRGLSKREIYEFDIELIIQVAGASGLPPGVSVPYLSTEIPTPLTIGPGGPNAQPSPNPYGFSPGGPNGPYGPGGPNGTYGPGGVLPSYTNTVYEDITSTFTRCPVCEAETTIFAMPVGTTCITAEVYTTPCEVTTTRTDEHGGFTTDVYTTDSYIPYNPAESTTVVTTEADSTTTIAKTVLVAVTKQVLKPTGTGESSPELEKTKNGAEHGPQATGPAAPGAKTPEEVAPEDTPEAASTEAPGSGASGQASPGGESDSGNSPFRVGPAASDYPASSGSGSTSGDENGTSSGTGSGPGSGNGNEGETTPDNGSGQTTSPYVTAGATRFGSDMLVETFVLLSGIAFGVVLLL